MGQFYKKEDRKESLLTSVREANSIHNKLKKKSKKGDRKKKARQEHGGCREGWEGREEQKFSLYRSMNQMSEKCPQHKRYQSVSCKFWRVFTVESIQRLTMDNE